MTQESRGEQPRQCASRSARTMSHSRGHRSGRIDRHGHDCRNRFVSILPEFWRHFGHGEVAADCTLRGNERAVETTWRSVPVAGPRRQPEKAAQIIFANFQIPNRTTRAINARTKISPMPAETAPNPPLPLLCMNPPDASAVPTCTESRGDSNLCVTASRPR